LFLESEEKIEKAKESHQNKVFSNAIYHAYSSLVNSAKAMLLSEDISTNSHANIIQQFDEVFISSDKISLETTFSKLIYQIQEQKPTAIFSEKYIQDANYFLQKVIEYRKLETSFLKENQ
jgi:sulfite reductase (ferredoxin)